MGAVALQRTDVFQSAVHPLEEWSAGRFTP